MIAVLQSPIDQIREARWWLREVCLDLPPHCTSPRAFKGCTPALVSRTRRWVAELVVKHVRGQLEPREVIVDETIPF